MKRTSFGFKEEFLFENQRVEYLEFQKEGRPHRHDEVEVFKVLEGAGKLNIDNEEIDLLEGDVRSIPRNRSHYMEPLAGGRLKLLVFYKT
ncbi:MAG: cupin domain-containing protein [Bdellovibrionales bacterium]